MPEDLLPQHQALIDASSISAEVAAARGYRSIRAKAELRGLGFPDRQIRVPALGIPLYDVRGAKVGTQTRPDEPRMNGTGRSVKYELPASYRSVLDAHPSITPLLSDPQVPLFVTEGVRKADAAVSRGLCCLALLGVYSWRGSNDLGGTTVLADWEHVTLRGRLVLLAFDSDLLTNPEVHNALRRLKAWLERRGAEVKVVLLPPGPNGQKVGLDDYLAAGHTTQDLLNLAVPDLPPLPKSEAAGNLPYREVNGGLVWDKPAAGGAVETPLTNYEARILRDVLEDDGAETIRTYEIEARVNGRVAVDRVPAREFNGLNWVNELLGAEAATFPGFGLKDHVQFAIRTMSAPIPRSVIYTHFGWRQIEGRWYFLHTGGALGAEEIDGVEVRPLRGLERYRLPARPDPAALREAVRRSLGFLTIAPPAQTWPILAAIWAAPLAEVAPMDFALWVHGPTGERKSSAVALALSHFGDFARNTLPGNFLSTGNALEIKMFHAKDLPFPVDDYAPPPEAKSAAAQDATAHRLLRGIGDTRGRDRATPDARLRGEKPPRALPIVTAELPPPGTQSSEARTVEVEWLPRSVDLDRLTLAQAEDAAHYPAAMAGYLTWLAPRLDTLRAEALAWVRAQAKKLPDHHGRVQESCAKLLIGVSTLLRFAVEAGAITAEEQERREAEAVEALTACAERTGRHQADRKPTALFLDFLNALLVQKQAYLADRETGEPPEEPALWGYVTWQGLDETGAPETKAKPRDGAEKVGWVDAAEGVVYLLPIAAHRAVTRYAQGANVRYPATKRSLGESLDREGKLLRKSPGRLEYRTRCEGKPEYTWPIYMFLLSGETENSENNGNSGPRGDDPKHEMDAGGGGSCSQSPEQSENRTGNSGPDPFEDPEPVPTSVLTPDLEVGTETPPVEAAPPHETGPGRGSVPTVLTVLTSGSIGETCSSAHALISRTGDLPALIEALAPAEIIALDTETTGLNPRKDRLRLLSLASDHGTWLVDCAEVDPAALFQRLAAKRLVGHNLGFDLGFLAGLGFVPGQVEDTMILSKIINAKAGHAPKGFYSLEETAKRELGVDLPKDLQKSDWGGSLTREQWEYAARDAAVLLPLYRHLRQQVRAAGLEKVAEIERRCLPAVSWMKGEGVPFDGEAWEALTVAAEAEVSRLEAELNAAAPTAPGRDLGIEWRWTNPKIVQRVLREVGCEVPNTKDETLAALDHPLAALIRQHRAASKRVSTYGSKWLDWVEDGRIFPDWKQVGSEAGRMACGTPNAQNVPRDLRYRACFAAPPGRVLVKADYSQIELRIAAKVANEPRMLEAYQAGKDLHTLTAQSILGKEDVTKADRQIAKAVNFGLIYGMGAKTLRADARKDYGVELTEADAIRYCEAFFKNYAGLRRWRRSQPKGAIATRTLTGRRRLGVSQFTEQLNTPVQGTGADGMKRALALLWERREQREHAFPVIACHDEIVVECPASDAEAVAAWLRQAMLDGMEPLIAPVPVEVEVQIGRTWADEEQAAR